MNQLTEAYALLLHKVYKHGITVAGRTGQTKELLNTQLTVSLDSPNDFYIHSEERNVNYEYAESFAEFILSGAKFDKAFFDKYPHTKKFIDHGGELPATFSTAYGPRIKEQLDDLLWHLAKEPNSRRAVLHILYPNDKQILGTKVTMEYPCTKDVQFSLRNGLLNISINMRSNDVYNVLPYDLFNFMTLFEYVRSLLARRTGLDIKLGTYHHSITSAHYLVKDEEQLKHIVNEVFQDN
jgi:thymidylate synthase